MSKKIRILIVDDSPSFRKGMQALLEIQPDMDVVGTAANGELAMGLIEQFEPDLILLDAQMPGMNGLEAVQQIKGRWPKMEVILVTMFSDYRAKAIEVGADAFLTKGIPPEHVLSVIRGIVHA